MIIYYKQGGVRITVITARAIKGGRGNAGRAPLILNLSNRWRRVVNFMPRLLNLQERAPVHTEEGAGWVPKVSTCSGGDRHHSILVEIKPWFIQSTAESLHYAILALYYT